MLICPLPPKDVSYFEGNGQISRKLLSEYCKSGGEGLDVKNMGEILFNYGRQISAQLFSLKMISTRV